MFHVDPMKQTLCACGEIARQKQRNCYRCHALANQVYRARVKHSAEKAKELLLRVMRERFEATTSCVLHLTDS